MNADKWLIKNGCLNVTLVLAFTAPCTAISGGLSLDVGLKAEVGLSDETISVINNFPEDLRENALRLLLDAKPYIDESVTLYFEKVEAGLSNAIAKARCDVIGATLSVTDAIGNKLFNNKPTPVEDLQKAWQEISFSKSEKISRVKTVYADFSYELENTLCQVLQSEPAVLHVIAVRSKLNPRWQMWNRVGQYCDTFASCYSHAFTHMKNTLSSADKRDIESAEMSPLIESIQEPKTSFWSWSFNHNAYEVQIVNILAITDAIDAARMRREGKYSLALAELEGINKGILDSEAKRADYDGQTSSGKSYRHLKNMRKFLMNLQGPVDGYINRLEFLRGVDVDLSDKIENSYARASKLKIDIINSINKVGSVEKEKGSRIGSEHGTHDLR